MSNESESAPKSSVSESDLADVDRISIEPDEIVEVPAPQGQPDESFFNWLAGRHGEAGPKPKSVPPPPPPAATARVIPPTQAAASKLEPAPDPDSIPAPEPLADDEHAGRISDAGTPALAALVKARYSDRPPAMDASGIDALLTVEHLRAPKLPATPPITPTLARDKDAAPADPAPSSDGAPILLSKPVAPARAPLEPPPSVAPPPDEKHDEKPVVAPLKKKKKSSAAKTASAVTTTARANPPPSAATAPSPNVSVGGHATTAAIAFTMGALLTFVVLRSQTPSPSVTPEPAVSVAAVTPTNTAPPTPSAEAVPSNAPTPSETAPAPTPPVEPPVANVRPAEETAPAPQAAVPTPPVAAQPAPSDTPRTTVAAAPSHPATRPAHTTQEPAQDSPPNAAAEAPTQAPTEHVAANDSPPAEQHAAADPPAAETPHETAPSTNAAPTEPAPVANNDTPPTEHAASDAPETPSRDDVRSALTAVQDSVVDCVRQDTRPNLPTSARVMVTFASTGHVTIANVESPFAGTPTGSCIARAVRSAAVPPFTRTTFTVGYPFRW